MFEQPNLSQLKVFESKTKGPVRISKVTEDNLLAVHQAELLVEGRNAASLETFQARKAIYPEGFLYGRNSQDLVIGYLEAFRWNRETMAIQTEVPNYVDLHNPNGKYLYIFLVATIPVFRHEGVASFLMKALQELARRSGIEAVQLATRPGLVSKLYEPLGFTTVHIAPNFYQGDSHNVLEWRPG